MNVYQSQVLLDGNFVHAMHHLRYVSLPQLHPCPPPPQHEVCGGSPAQAPGRHLPPVHHVLHTTRAQNARPKLCRCVSCTIAINCILAHTCRGTQYQQAAAAAQVRPHRQPCSSHRMHHITHWYVVIASIARAEQTPASSTGTDNSNHFFVATQDKHLRHALLKVRQGCTCIELAAHVCTDPWGCRHQLRPQRPALGATERQAGSSHQCGTTAL